METRSIKLEKIGIVTLQRSKRAKHINISVQPFKGVRVAVPYGVSFKAAEEFVRSKVNWIAKHQQRMRKIEIERERLKDESEAINQAKTKEMLITRLNELARQNGFSYNKVSIRNQKTRWGSCSKKNNINLNMKMVKLPQKLIDYVILHELVHTKIKNHSKKFWDELVRYIPDSKILDKELRKYGVGLL